MGIILSVLKWIGILILLLVLAIAGYIFAMRFADGPAGIVAGGEFTSGTPYQGEEPDWSFLKDRAEVEFQLLEPVRSRTTWVVEHENRIYIPSGYMNTPWGKIWKQWPIEAEQHPDILLRVDGVIYPRKLVRLTTGEQLPVIVSELGRKYMNQLVPDGDPQEMIEGGLQQIRDGDLWIFELVAR